MTRRFLKSVFGILIAAVCFLPALSSAEDQILAVLLENGDLPPPQGQVLHFPLFCEGGAHCGTVDLGIVNIVRFDEEGMELILDTKVCQGLEPNTSCVTAGHARFVASALPIPQPKGIAYATHMVEHDPIQCSGVTGDFFVPGCKGKLDLNYRCMMVADPATKTLLKSFASSYIVSERP